MSQEHERKTVILIAFYNIKALGVRYLEAALQRKGYRVVTVFFKDFNSIRPRPATDKELQLLADLVRQEQPMLVGFSVMSSMYLEPVEQVIATVQKTAGVPTVCGGAFATMFPQHFLERGVDFVIRTDGELSFGQLADALVSGESWQEIPSLCYRTPAGEIVQNPIGNILADVDEYGIPAVVCEHAYFIEKDAITPGDPQLDTLSYEVIASRGCPYTCSYCCCINLRRLFPRGTPYVRTRSVQSVIEELKLVKKTFKKLVFVHFYDEIFPNLPGWVDEFAVEYEKHIGLPFTIWSHPKMVDAEMLRKLVSVGLTEVIMGIQSGSPHIRRDVFHRYETQEDILAAVRTIKEAGVGWASYDFMLQHPFETLEDLQETYDLVKQMPLPYELQLHGLNFLPGTDIVKMALDQGIVSAQEMDSILYAPMEDQFQAYWKQEEDPMSQVWYQMIYCLQFPGPRQEMARYESDPAVHVPEIAACYAKCQKRYQRRYYWKKGKVVLKRLQLQLRRH